MHEIVQTQDLKKSERKESLNGRRRVLLFLWTILDKGIGHQLVLFFVDFFACAGGVLCGWALGRLGFGIEDSLQNYLAAIPILTIGIVISFYLQGGYRPSYLRRQERELEIIVKTTIFSFLFISSFNFLVFKSAVFSRYIYVFDCIFVLVFLLFGRFGLKRFYRQFWRNKIGREKAIVLGKGPKSTNWLRQQFRIQQFSRFEFIGYIHRNNPCVFYNRKGEKVFVRANIDDFLKSLGINTIFVALDEYSPKSHRFFLDMSNICKKNNYQMFVLSEIFMNNEHIYNPDEYVGLLGIRWSRSELEKRVPPVVKRTLDITISFFMSVILFPLMILIAMAIKLQDGGPVLYRRRVVGRFGIPFDAFKFRSMVRNADEVLAADQNLRTEFEKNFKLKKDMRITRIGKILRKLSLDELPQLYNVFIGQMSLVGPRMVVPEELKNYGKFKNERIKIRPGLSGYWQVNGRQKVSYMERIRMDQFYMYRWSIWMDFWILLKTVQKVFKMEGAY